MADKLQLGKAFLADLIARAPEEARATLANLVEDDSIVTFAGEGALRQQDYSRSMNDAAAIKKQADDLYLANQQWYETNKAALDAAAKNGTQPPVQPTPGFDMAAVEKVINERERGVANYIAVSTSLALRHFKEFGEELSLPDLLADPNVNKLGILGVYEQKFAPRYQEKAQLAEKSRIDAAVEARMVEERKKFVASPYPVSPNPMDPSPLDALEAAQAATDKFSPQAAADEYTALVARRQASGA